MDAHDLQLIRSHVEKYIQLKDEEFSIFASRLMPRLVKPKQPVLQQGMVCQQSIFVLKGIVRGYSSDKNGVEHVLSFAPEGWWIADMYSLISGLPSTLNLECLEDSSLLFLQKDEQEQLYEQVPKFERYFRILIENSLVSTQQRVLDNLSLSAEERFEKFCKNFPQLIHRVPQKHLASYIEVTPEFFSKMKNRFLKK
jgi:CRP-like cAMP-binding protein